MKMKFEDYDRLMLYRLGLAEILGHEEAPATDWSSMDDEELTRALEGIAE